MEDTDSMHPEHDWRQQRREERQQRRQERWEARRHGANPLGGAIFGLLLIGGGLLFLLRNLGIVYFENLGQYWPVILIGLGASQLLNNRLLPGLMLTFIGGIFLARNLGYLYGSVGSYIWPAALIAVGVSILLRNLYGPDWFQGAPATEGVGSVETGNTLRAEVIFGSLMRRNISQDFEGGKVSVVFGEIDVDLRSAATKRQEVVIHADAVFGAVNLRVPDTWRVEVRGSGVFGGYEDRTHPPAQGLGTAPKVIVKGSAVFGAVEVRN